MNSEAKCYACGGPVNEHGMAEGGEVEAEGFPESPTENEADESRQMQQGEDDAAAARRAFVRAVKGGR